MFNTVRYTRSFISLFSLTVLFSTQEGFYNVTFVAGNSLDQTEPYTIIIEIVGKTTMINIDDFQEITT